MLRVEEQCECLGFQKAVKKCLIVALAGALAMYQSTDTVPRIYTIKARRTYCVAIVYWCWCLVTHTTEVGCAAFRNAALLKIGTGVG
jgi:hypothetical protein